MKILKSLLSLVLVSSPVNAVAQSTNSKPTIVDRLEWNLAYQFETRTSNKLGAEREKNILKNGALLSLSYDLKDATLGLEGSLIKVERSESKDDDAVDSSSYRGKVISPSLSVRTRNFNARLAAQYANIDSQLFEVNAVREPSLAGSLDILAGRDLKLKAALAGRTNQSQTVRHSLGYLGLRSPVAVNLYGDLGVAHEKNEFYGQSLTYGILGLDSSTQNTSVRTELSAGEKFSAKLSLVTKVKKHLGLSVSASASKELGDVRKVNDVSVTAGLKFF